MKLWIRIHGKEIVVENVINFAYDYYTRTLNVSIGEPSYNDVSYTDVTAFGVY